MRREFADSSIREHRKPNINIYQVFMIEVFLVRVKKLRPRSLSLILSQEATIFIIIEKKINTSPSQIMFTVI